MGLDVGVREGHAPGRERLEVPVRICCEIVGLGLWDCGIVG